MAAGNAGVVNQDVCFGGASQDDRGGVQRVALAVDVQDGLQLGRLAGGGGRRGRCRGSLRRAVPGHVRVDGEMARLELGILVEGDVDRALQRVLLALGVLERDRAQFLRQSGSPLAGACKVVGAEPNGETVRCQRAALGQAQGLGVHFIAQAAGDLHRLDVAGSGSPENTGNQLLQAALNIVDGPMGAAPLLVFTSAIGAPEHRTTERGPGGPCLPDTTWVALE